MKKEQLSFTHFKQYALFLLENCLDELTIEDIKRCREVDLPLLQLFTHLSEEELFNVSRSGISEYLQSIIQGNAIDKVIQSNNDWKEDKVAGVPRDKVVASDIALIYNIRKHSLRHFLPRYSSDIQLIVSILDEIDDYYTFQEELAITTFAEINKEEITKREKSLKEAQELAKLGYWEYDLETGKIVWSDELYRVYGFENTNEIAADLIQKHIYEEDTPQLMDSVKRIYQNGGSFTQEYRIRRSDGETRYLLDKGYTEKTLSGKVLVKGISQDITERKLAEEKLSENDFFIKNVAENAPFLISVYDFEKAETVYVNQNAYELIGYSKEDLKTLGLEIVNLSFHPDDAPQVGALLERVKTLSDGEVAELEYRVKDSSGSWKWLASSVSPFRRNEKGEVVQILSFASDINEKKEAIDEIKKNETLLSEAQEISHLGSWEWDTDKNFVSWSNEMFRLFGYQPNEINMDYETYMGHVYSEDKELVASHVLKCLNEGKTYSYDHRIVRKDGELRWLQAKGQVTLKQDGRNLKLAGTAMDITHQKKAEEAIQQRSEALMASNKELEAFCYTISHDLRSPLRAIDGFGRKLFNLYGEKLDQEGQRLLSIVRTNARQMGVLIDSLLDFSRLNRKEINKSAIDMAQLVEQVLEEATQQESDVKVQIKTHQLLDAMGDRELLKLVWTNLISNAIKFSSKKEHPVIEIGSENKGKQVVFYTKDNGAGFEMEYIDKLFGVFQRLHSQDEFHGTGVGLATVQRIIHRHGGRVWAEGELNKGATFYFSLSPSGISKESILTLNTHESY